MPAELMKEIRKPDPAYWPDAAEHPLGQTGPRVEFPADLLDRITAEAWVTNYRRDAWIGGVACYKQIQWGPIAHVNNLGETVRNPDTMLDAYGFLDGDTPEAAEAARVGREQRLIETGLPKDSGLYEAKLEKLTVEERAATLAERIIPGDSESAHESREAKQDIFEYIVRFWERSTISLPVGANTGGGINLALRPFVAPTGPLPDSGFQFNESYKWDSFFQDEGLIRAGGRAMALNQLKNKVDVFAQFGLIPNALTTSFLSHSQPPLEALEINALREAGGSDDWLPVAMTTLERDLWYWLDAGSGLKTDRQTMVKNPISIFKDNHLLTRHSNIHFSPGLVGCEDGKDHYEIPHVFGVSYLPVQLNAILQGHFETLANYFQETGDDHKAKEYTRLAIEHKRQFNEVFWEGDDPGWKGYRNYALPGNGFDGQEGRIKFDDLSAEVFPLAFGLANDEQAAIVKDNIMNYYLGDQGLSSTNPDARPGSINLEKYSEELDKFQWRAPNCWPPLVYMAVKGLERYGFTDEANDIRDRWMAAQEQNFQETGYFHEKSVYDSSYEGVNPGLYGTIKGGFGWTIGVYLKFLHDKWASPSSPA